MYWQSYDDESKVCAFVASEVAALATKNDLATTGKNLAAAFQFDEGTKQVLQHFKIFARMTPDAKETVIECLHSVGLLCLMCGDGANDVGALKAADVGVALLSGFGDVNVDKGEDANKKKMQSDVLPPIERVLPPNQLDAMRNMPVWIIKQQIKKVGGNPDQYPELVEKEDLIKLFEIRAREQAYKKQTVVVGGKKMNKAEAQAKGRYGRKAAEDGVARARARGPRRPMGPVQGHEGIYGQRNGRSEKEKGADGKESQRRGFRCQYCCSAGRLGDGRATNGQTGRRKHCGTVHE